MASDDDSSRKWFTFIWKLENASYCWQSRLECIENPSFTVGDLQDAKWKLELFPYYENKIGLFLRRQKDAGYVGRLKMNCDLAFISSEGSVLSIHKGAFAVAENAYFGTYGFILRNEVFSTRKSVFLSQDTLTTRCRMWKSSGEMSNDVQCFARTHIAVEKSSFLWNIKNFSALESHSKRTYFIQSYESGESVMTLEMFLTGGRICDEAVRFKIIPNYQNVKMSITFQLSIVEAAKNTLTCFRDEFWCHDSCDSKDYTLFRAKSELLEKKTKYLPNDVLSLWCECAFSFGTVQSEIERVDSDCIAVAKMKSDYHKLDKGNVLPISNCVFIDNLKSMLNNNSLSDVKLRTKSQTYPAHMSILGAQSPVFKAMFSNDMKENIKESVDIEDLNNDTLLRMVHYIYSAEVEELEWDSAILLHGAADKYEILHLKNICSSYLRSNLCPSNACEALVLADIHHDEDLKVSVQDFILRNVKDFINSEEWEKLMETNLKLDAETMRRKFKE